MKRKSIWLVAAFAACSSLGAMAVFKGRRAVEYRTVRPDRAPIESAISATGNLNAVVTVDVGTQVSGNIQALFADFNTRVTKGQLVARIDPQIFQARVNQAQANVDAARAAVGNAQAALQKSSADVSNAQAMVAIAQANLAKEKVNTADARTKYGRQQTLFTSGLIATADRDTAQALYDAQSAAVDAATAQVQAAEDGVRSAEAAREVARAQIASAQAQMKQQQAALEQARIDFEHTSIFAPVDGVVVSRQVSVGQTVAASLQAPTIFQIAQDLAKMQVDTNVDEADIGHVAVGQPATFTVDAYPTRAFRGAVTEIRKAPINVQNVVTYDVVIGVSNADLKLFPGMTANVRILVDHRDDALRIPSAALRFRPADAPVQKAAGRHAPAQQTVWVLAANGKPEAVPVTLGISDGAYTEVTGGGFTEASALITGTAQKSATTASTQARAPQGPRPF